MSQNAKQIKSRIKSVKSTKKITKSMQLISAVKMQKVVKHIARSREYSRLADVMIQEIGNNVSIKNPLLEEKEAENELLVIIASDRGLCGSYNYNVQKNLTVYVKQHEDISKIKTIAIGKKAAIFAKKMGLEVISLYEKIGDNPESALISPIHNDILSKFNSNEFKNVTMIYTKYISGFVNEATIKQLLPIKTVATENEDELGNYDENKVEYKIEPNPEEVLDYILPKIFESQFFQYVLESSASEHSSRMSAMKNATEAADEMATSLTYELNKSRQSQITQEVAEIVGGIIGIRKKNEAEALSKVKVKN